MKSFKIIPIMLVIFVLIMLSFSNSLGNKSKFSNFLKSNESDNIKKRINVLFDEVETKRKCVQRPDFTTTEGGLEMGISGKSFSAKSGSWNIPKSKYNKYEKRLYGWGPSAYLFDFLDPVLLKPIMEAFTSIWESANAEPLALSSKDKEDPYTLQKIFNMPTADQETLLTKFESLKKTFKRDVWNVSLTIPKVRAATASWPYNAIGSDPAKEIVDAYDYNGDGRLSMKEFFIAYLNINRAILGSQDCSPTEINCMHKVVRELLNPIFIKVDCHDSDNKVGAEDMWKALEKLIRSTADYNIFLCMDEQEPIHTTAINDFILKSEKTINGYLNKLEFVRGILLGYWGRYITDKQFNYCRETETGCTRDQAFNEMKKTRWIAANAKCNDHKPQWK